MKGLWLSLRVIFFKSVNKLTWQSYKQERGCLMHFAHLTNTLQKDVTAAYFFTHNAPKCRILIETFPDMLRYSEFPRCEGHSFPTATHVLRLPGYFNEDDVHTMRARTCGRVRGANTSLGDFQGGYIFYAGASLAGAGYCRQCRRRPAILPLQL